MKTIRLLNGFEIPQVFFFFLYSALKDLLNLLLGGSQSHVRINRTAPLCCFPNNWTIIIIY